MGAPYADISTLLARAGRLAPAWTEDSDPDLADLEVFLANTAAEIDAELLARSISLPLDSAPAASLAGLNADGALVIAIEATFVGARSEEVTNILTGARARWTAGLDSMRNGTNTLIKWLEQSTAAGVGASSFWETEALSYGVVSSDGFLDVPSEWAANPGIAPGVYRDQRG